MLLFAAKWLKLMRENWAGFVKDDDETIEDFKDFFYQSRGLYVKLFLFEIGI